MTDDPALPRVGDIVGTKYRIERRLGGGGMSAVFEVSHLLTGSKFAIKWLLPEIAAREDGVRRFVREAKVAGRFKHPNVVDVYDFCEAADAESFYMVMELLEGESLDARLEREGKLSPADACRILVPCMRAVGRAHAAGVIHRDLKPGNIFICAATEERPELPKVLDFGISRVSDFGVRSDSPITETGMWMGTPHYMSPEQVRNRPVDHRADIYAFGVILYEVLSGDLPFHSESLSALMVKVAVEDPAPLVQLLPDIEPGLAEVVHRALARAPAARYQDMDAMVRALLPYLPADAQRAESQLVMAAAPATPETDALAPTIEAPAGTPAPEPQHARSRWMPAAFALGVAAVAALSFWLLGMEQPPAKPIIAAPDTKSEAPALPSPAADRNVGASLEPPREGPHGAAPVEQVAAEPPAANPPHPARTREGASASSAKRAARAPASAPERNKPGSEQPERAPAPTPAREKPSSLSGVSFDLDDFMPKAQAQQRSPVANNRP